MFELRLARHLGCTVAELYQRMAPEELAEHWALERIDPLPDWWFMWRWLMGAITHKSPDKFDFTRVKRGQSVAETKAKFLALAKRKHQ